MASPRVIRVGVPGPRGATGPYPSSMLQESFIQPEIDGTVSVSVNSTAWMAAGQSVFVSTGGSYTVASVVSEEIVDLINTGASGNAPPGTEIQSGEKIVVSGSGEGSGVISIVPGYGISVNNANPENPVVSVRFIDQLEATVGPGGDFEEWDLFYRAVSVMRGGVLSITLTGTHENLTNAYPFLSWNSVNISCSGGFNSSGRIVAAVTNSEGSQNVFSGDISCGGVLELDGFTIAPDSSFSAIMTLFENCSNTNSESFAVDGICNLYNSRIYNAVVSSGLIMGGNSYARDCSAYQLYQASGVATINGFTCTASSHIDAAVVDLQGTKAVLLGAINCGSAGADYAVGVGDGAIAIDRSTISGVFDEKYNQPVDLQTTDGLIVVPAPQSATYAEFKTLNPADYPEGTEIWCSDRFVNVRSIRISGNPYWMATAPFVEYQARPNDLVTGTTSESLFRSVEVSTAILGPKYSIQAYCSFPTIATGMAIRRLKISESASGTSGTNIFASASNTSAYSLERVTHCITGTGLWAPGIITGTTSGGSGAGLPVTVTNTHAPLFVKATTENSITGTNSYLEHLVIKSFPGAT